MSCYHCKFCHTCFSMYEEYIKHFRIDGKLVFLSCSNAPEKD